MSSETKKVTLLRAHTHAGEDHPAGARLRVPKRLTEWLSRQGVIDAPRASRTISDDEGMPSATEE